MKLKVNEDTLILPKDLYQLISIVVFTDGFWTDVRFVPLEFFFNIKKKEKDTTGRPMMYTTGKDANGFLDSILIAPKADKEYDIEIHYTTVHKI